jgi:hypothetical protein
MLRFSLFDFHVEIFLKINNLDEVAYHVMARKMLKMHVDGCGYFWKNFSDIANSTLLAILLFKIHTDV